MRNNQFHFGLILGLIFASVMGLIITHSLFIACWSMLLGYCLVGLVKNLIDLFNSREEVILPCDVGEYYFVPMFMLNEWKSVRVKILKIEYVKDENIEDFNITVISLGTQKVVKYDLEQFYNYFSDNKRDSHRILEGIKSRKVEVKDDMGF